MYTCKGFYISHSRTASAIHLHTGQLCHGVLFLTPPQRSPFPQLLYGFGCNIVSSDQFSDPSCSMFFQRITFDFSDIVIGPGNTSVLERAIGELASRFTMKWQVGSEGGGPRRGGGWGAGERIGGG